MIYFLLSFQFTAYPLSSSTCMKASLLWDICIASCTAMTVSSSQLLYVPCAAFSKALYALVRKEVTERPCLQMLLPRSLRMRSDKSFNSWSIRLKYRNLYPCSKLTELTIQCVWRCPLSAWVA